MPEINMKDVVGGSFEDMSVVEMAMVQGSGDVEVESTIASFISWTLAITAASGSFASGVQIVKTVHGNC